MNLRVPKMRGISWLAAEPVSFSRRTLLHGVSKYYYYYSPYFCERVTADVLVLQLIGQSWCLSFLTCKIIDPFDLCQSCSCPLSVTNFEPRRSRRSFWVTSRNGMYRERSCFARPPCCFTLWELLAGIKVAYIPKVC